MGGRADPLWWCYLLLGCGTLTPWNSLIGAADYWEARFPVSALPCLTLQPAPT